MSSPILVARTDAMDLHLLPEMANRHGLIAGATGTGKTVTLQVLAENFSARGVPVFLADIKGDLSGISRAGGQSAKVQERIKALRLSDFVPTAFPATFWDVFGAKGHPVRATVSEMGPLLLSRLLQLNDTQDGVLSLVFRIADENGLLLLDLKDLRAMLNYVGENSAAFTTRFGNISAASIGAIQRNLLALDGQGGDRFFGEPALNLDDFMQTDSQGRGVVNILAADALLQSPKVYATLLLWMLSELYERLPECGDLEKPKLVFFFDEAHLLFSDIPKVLLEKIEQIVRLIRSKGVGVYFVTQNPRDIPDVVLGQLGNRVQHALRAFTPQDQKVVRAAAETFRANPELNTSATLLELGVGEALVSMLDSRGQPEIVQRAFVVPPRSQIGPISTEERQKEIGTSLVAGVYDKAVDRESAYERLTGAHGGNGEGVEKKPAGAGQGGFFSQLFGGDSGSAPVPLPTAPKRGGRQPESLATALTKSVVRTMGSSIGREIARGIMGSIFGGTRRR